MKAGSMATVAILLGLGGGCDGAEADRASAYRRALPDERVLVDMPAPDAAARRSEAGDPSEAAAATAQVSGDVNAMIGSVLALLDTIVSFDPSWTDGEQTALWGPWEDGGMTYALWVTHEQAEGLYSWGIDMKRADEGEDAFVTVIAGQTGDDATDEDYAGWFVLDFDAIAAKNPDEPARGAFASEFDVSGEQVTASAGFEGFRDQADAESDAVDALYHYEQVVGGEGLMDLVYLADATGDGQDEYHVLRSRWAATGAGRSDAYLTGGDLGALTFTATECWDDSFTVSFYENNYDFARSGDEATCAFDEPSFREDGDTSASR